MRASGNSPAKPATGHDFLHHPTSPAVPPSRCLTREGSTPCGGYLFRNEIDNPWGAAQHRRFGHGECIFGYGYIMLENAPAQD